MVRGRLDDNSKGMVSEIAEEIEIVNCYVTKFDELLEKTKECLQLAENKLDVVHNQTMYETHHRVLHVLNTSFDMLNEEKEGLNHLKDYLARLSEYTAQVYGPPADFMNISYRRHNKQ